MCQICASLHAYVPDCAYDPVRPDLPGVAGELRPGAVQTSLILPGDATPLDVALEAGVHYEIALAGGTDGGTDGGSDGGSDGAGFQAGSGTDVLPDLSADLSAGVLTLRDAAGDVVATAGAGDTLRFTAPAEGSYQLSFLPAAGTGLPAASTTVSTTGSNGLTSATASIGITLDADRTGPVAAAMAAASGGGLDAMADYLVRGYWESLGSTWHFWQQPVITTNITGLDAEGRQLARWALDVWSATTGLEFRFVQQGGDLTFGNDQAGAFAQSFFDPGTHQIASSHVNISRAWLNNSGTTLDSHSFHTFLHEIGHALGLGHAGPYGGNAVYSRDAIFAEDSWQMTLMSYFNQTQNTHIDATRAFALTPMRADIMALDTLYNGLDPAAAGGNSVYGVGGNIGGTLGMLWDKFIGQGGRHGDAFASNAPIALTIHDTGGYNRVNLRNDRDDQRVDMNGGGIWDVYGQTGTLVLSSDTRISAFDAGSGNNHITGNNLGNQIVGGSASDTIMGGAGNDLIRGMAGDDLIRVTGGNNTIWGGEGADTIHGGTGNDRIGGGPGRDLIHGTAGNNQLWGGPGNDTIHGGRGNDSVGGGTGDDLIYAGGGSNRLWGGVGNDTIHGGDNGDTIGGGPGNDVIYGGDGDDIILAGPGSDQIWGGGGADSFQFYRDGDWNVINDFSFWQGDMLALAPGLWRGTGQSLDARQLVDRYGEVNEWGHIVLDFGPANTTIVLQDVSDLIRLVDHIEIL